MSLISTLQTRAIGVYCREEKYHNKCSCFQPVPALFVPPPSAAEYGGQELRPLDYRLQLLLQSLAQRALSLGVEYERVARQAVRM